MAKNLSVAGNSIRVTPFCAMPIRSNGFELAATETLASPERYSGLFSNVTGGITERLLGGLRRANLFRRVFAISLVWLLAVSCAPTGELTTHRAINAKVVVMDRSKFISPPYRAVCGVATEIAGGGPPASAPEV